MSSCRICGIHFNNAQQLGSHVRRCKRTAAAAAAAAAAHTTATVTAATATESVVITEPVAAPANTDLLALAPRERLGRQEMGDDIRPFASSKTTTDAVFVDVKGLHGG